MGASYNFGVAKAFATYQTTKRTNIPNTLLLNPNASKSDKAWSVGVAVPVTSAGTVIASYANLNDSVGATSSAERDGTAYTVAYTHALSKRTTAYAGYAHQVNKADVAQTVNTTTAYDSTKTTQVVAGVRHSF